MLLSFQRRFCSVSPESSPLLLAIRLVKYILNVKTKTLNLCSSQLTHPVILAKMPDASESNFFGAIRKNQSDAVRSIFDDIADKSVKKTEAKSEVVAFFNGLEDKETGEQFFWVTMSHFSIVIFNLLHSFRV